VGKPLAAMMLNRNATVQVSHVYTKNLAEHTRRGDILVVAAGVPGLIKAEMVKPGAYVFDVGINRVGDKTVGDVDFDAVKEVASAITPVPGGVGPLTVSMLLGQVVWATEAQTENL
jgi:methylenetetrahydrofolate dehydrogenase (NADP+)/methenyltetrahydrofolate cyclohydrolase